MCSARPTDDLTTKARIRGAAIDYIARNGYPATTVRAIAQSAGVSPALVVHHFGSKQGLRTACDEQVADYFHREIAAATGKVGVADVIAQMAAQPEGAALAGYAAQALIDGGEFARTLVALIAADTRRYLDTGIAAGAIRPSSSPEMLAEYLTVQSLGAMMMARYLAPVGTNPLVLQDFVRERYTAVALELFTYGLFSDDGYLQAFSGRADPPGPEQAERS